MFIKLDTEKGITASIGLNFGDAMRILGSGISQIMHSLDDTPVAEGVDEKKRHGGIYDMFNRMAGSILDEFDAGRTPATALTAEAILKAENEILDEKTKTPSTVIAEDANKELR